MEATLQSRAVRRVRQGLVAVALGMSTWATGCHTLDDAFKRRVAKALMLVTWF